MLVPHGCWPSSCRSSGDVSHCRLVLQQECVLQQATPAHIPQPPLAPSCQPGEQGHGAQRLAGIGHTGWQPALLARQGRLAEPAGTHCWPGQCPQLPQLPVSQPAWQSCMELSDPGDGFMHLRKRMRKFLDDNKTSSAMQEEKFKALLDSWLNRAASA